MYTIMPVRNKVYLFTHSNAAVANADNHTTIDICVFLHSTSAHCVITMHYYLILYQWFLVNFNSGCVVVFAAHGGPWHFFQALMCSLKAAGMALQSVAIAVPEI